MIKKLLSLFTVILGALSFGLIPVLTTPHYSIAKAEEEYKGALVADYNTGTVIYEYDADKRMPIASMVKIMTLAIAFDEIDKGRLALNENIPISDYAAGMGGSQMFLESGDTYPVSDLLKGIIVCSANDAATAIGERISGSIQAFVEKMNAYAKEYGMNNTKFCNATGLPNSGEQYSSARDVTTMMRKVLSHPGYYDFSRIWMEDYSHPDGRVTQMVNTNKLIRSMPECDGGKTGFTNEAGFCLSATAKQGDTRLIATLLGGKDGRTRFRKVSDFLKSGFAEYETTVYLRKKERIHCDQPEIKRARTESVTVYTDHDLTRFAKKGTNDNITCDILFRQDLQAPIDKGSEIGEIVLKENGTIITSAKLYTEYAVEKMNFGDYLRRILNNRLFGK